MSLVTAAISYSSRIRRQSCSMRAVFPDPTGPPTPILGTDILCLLGNEEPGGGRFVPHRGDVDEREEAPQLLERHRVRLADEPGRLFPQPRQELLGPALAQRKEFHGRR